jgi:hypothetical protein
MPELLASPRASQKPFKEPEQTLACMFDAIERRADSMESRTAPERIPLRRIAATSAQYLRPTRAEPTSYRTTARTNRLPDRSCKIP